MKNNKGYTMIELLATITILGIIMTIAVPSVMIFVNRGREAFYDNQKKNLVHAAKSYVAATNYRPAKVGDYVDLSMDDLVSQKYIDVIRDSNKKKCYGSEDANGVEGDYTFVRVTRLSDKLKYEPHLFCPNYQDYALESSSKSMNATAQVVNDTDILLTLTSPASNGKKNLLTHYTYTLYDEDGISLFSSSRAVRGTTLNYTIHAAPYINSSNNNFKIAVRLVDKNENTYAKTINVSVNNVKGKLGCENVKRQTVGGFSYYSFTCSSGNDIDCDKPVYSGIASSNHVTLKDELGNNAGTCDIG